MIYDHLKPSIIIHYDVPSKTLPNTLTANTAPRPPVWVLERNPGVLQARVDWKTKCVFAARPLWPLKPKTCSLCSEDRLHTWHLAVNAQRRL